MGSSLSIHRGFGPTSRYVLYVLPIPFAERNNQRVGPVVRKQTMIATARVSMP